MNLYYSLFQLRRGKKPINSAGKCRYHVISYDRFQDDKGQVLNVLLNAMPVHSIIVFHNIISGPTMRRLTYRERNINACFTLHA